MGSKYTHYWTRKCTKSASDPATYYKLVRFMKVVVELSETPLDVEWGVNCFRINGVGDGEGDDFEWPKDVHTPLLELHEMVKRLHNPLFHVAGNKVVAAEAHMNSQEGRETWEKIFTFALHRGFTSFNQENPETVIHPKYENSCTTRAKSYDKVVCAALLYAADVYGKGFDFTSDGDSETPDELWTAGRELYEKACSHMRQQTFKRKRGNHVYLNCPYKDKEECKMLGGRWDKEAKKWYVPAGMDPQPFAKWVVRTG